MLSKIVKNRLKNSKPLLNLSLKPLSSIPNKDKILTTIDPDREQFDNFLQNIPTYEESLDDNLHPYFLKVSPLEGFATPEATLKYMKRAEDEVPHSNFKSPFDSELKLSSVGIGTYMGAPDDKTDFFMYEAIKSSVMSGGINVIDTAINYRYQKSERTVGKAINTLVNKYGYSRDELFVCTKGGFVPDDADQGIPGRVVVEELIKNGAMSKKDVINEHIHCMHPAFLNTQIDQSLKNLNLSTIDLYYLHNAYEMQGPNNTDNIVMDRFASAFEFLESAVQAGKIKNYGMATWL